MREVTLRVDNMHCGACVRRVTQALGRVDRLRVGEVRIGAARVEAPDDLPESVIVSAVQQAGYSAVVEN
jgi:copper chaperone